jgi:hypothetical protein
LALRLTQPSELALRGNWRWDGRALTAVRNDGLRLAAEERADSRIGHLVAQAARIALGDDASRLAVEQDHAIHRDEDAAEIVGHDDERDVEVLRQPADRGVERRRGDGIETRRRLVQEQDRRVERHRSRDAGALLHAARELRRHVPGERLQTDELELHPGDEVDRVVRKVRVHLERQPHVLEQRHRAEQRAGLVHHAESALNPLELALAPRSRCRRRRCRRGPRAED